MRVVIQKSKEAPVTVNEEVTGQIESGLVILLGITNDDGKEDIKYLADKIANLRLFEKEEKHFEESVVDSNKEILLISQFTLYASCKKGRRPDFGNSAKSDIAKPLYEEFIKELKAKSIKVETGIFGEDMKVNLTNDGPITIIIDSKTRE